MGLYHHSHQCVNQEWVPRSTCPSLPAFLSTCVLFHLSASFPVSLSVYLCVLLYIFPPIYRATLFIYTFFLFVFYSVCLGVSLSFAVHLSVSGYSFPFFVHRAALLFVCLPVYILLSHCASVCLSQPFFCPSFSTYECVYLFFSAISFSCLSSCLSLLTCPSACAFPGCACKRAGEDTYQRF